MEISKFPMLIVGVVVALVLAGAVLPVFAETTSTTDTFTNDGYFRMTTSIIDDEIVISWDSTKDSGVTVNGDYYDLESAVAPDQPKSIAFCNDCLIRFTDRGGFYSFEIWGENMPGGVDGVSSDTPNAASVTISQNSVTWIKNDADPVTVTTNGLWTIIDKDGNQIMKKMDKGAYITAESEFRGAGNSRVGTGDDPTTASFYIISGTIEGYTIESSIPVSNKEIVYSDVSNYVGLYSLDKLTFTSTFNSAEVNQTYSYFVVPYEVTAEKTVYPYGALSVMLNVLPLLAIAGLVAGSVAWFIMRK